MITLLIILLIIFTLISFFFSLSQISFFSLSSAQVCLLKEDLNPKKREIAQLLFHPRNLLVTLLFGDILANILVQNTAANLFSSPSNWGYKVGIPLVLTLFLGEIVPKTIAMQKNEMIATKVAPILSLLQKVLGPIRYFVIKITTFLYRSLFFFLKKERTISIEEISHVLKTSQESGVISSEEVELIDGYLSLGKITVKERMHPRHEVLFYNIEEPLTKLTHLFVNEECSQIPICHNDLQHLKGILTAKSFFHHQGSIHQPSDVLRFTHKAFYVPETIHGRILLKQFLERQINMGIVVDEYGSITGLITAEDLYEVVIGEIKDKRDKRSHYTDAGEGVIITSGKLELSEFEEIYGVSLPSENNMVTIGGWLTEKFGEIPKGGATYKWRGFEFRVLYSNPNRVRRIYIRNTNNKKETT
ncbi:MAG: HlyC/CorC family transporter [Chlamydiia bacterium]|nr:HlyC/CorC family transporter [Chlamydiia bacterium]